MSTPTAPRTAPPTAPLGGFALLRGMRRDPLALLTRLHRDHGRIVRLRVPRVPVYLVAEPEVIQEALTRTDHEYAKGLTRRGDPAGPGVQPLSRILGQGLLTSPAPLHRRQRRLIQPMFHRARIAGYAAEVTRLAETAVMGWPDGRARDVHRDMTELTLAIIARTVFDADLDNDVVATIRAAVHGNQPALRRAATPVGRLLDRLPLPSTRRGNRARRDLDAVVYQLLADRRASGLDGADVLSLLLAARDADTGESMPDAQIRDEAMTLLLAGHETTANALAWSLHLLAVHPTVQQRLREELHSVLGQRQATLADLPDLPYTAGVWREALRLYPPAWIVARRLTGDRIVGGHPLPAGSMLLLSPYVVHRDPGWWPEPDTFQPERFLPDPSRAAAPDRHRYAYFPFGGGPRQCIGNDFADMEGVLVLAAIARRWRLRPTATVPVAQALVTLRPRDGVHLTVHSGQN